MKKAVLILIMLFTLASIGFVCADNSTDDIENGHMYIRTNGEFNPVDVDSSKTYASNSPTEYLPITDAGGSYKGTLNEAQVNVSGLEDDDDKHGEVWSHTANKYSSTGEVNLNKYFNISDDFANYANDLGNNGIGYNENVSNTILKVWYPDIWDNVTNLHINTTKDGYKFFAYVIKKQSDGIHIDGVLVSAFVFKVVEIKNNVNGENPDADIEEILDKLDDNITNYVNDTQEEPEILRNIIDDPIAATNDTTNQTENNSTTDDNITDNQTTDDGFSPLTDTNNTSIPVNDTNITSTAIGNEDSVDNTKDVVSGKNVTGNPILLIVIVIGLLAGAYVKR